MIIIRVDANEQIGMGHLMRCLSIADAARNLGHDITFILADNKALSLIKDRGYEAIVLQSSYEDMESEIGLWPSITPAYIIIDSYYATASYLKTLKKKLGNQCKLIYIDDLAAFPYPVDILVNYNAYGMILDYHRLYSVAGVEEPRLILGPNYAPLRAMFRGVPRRDQKKNPETVLISTGGSDELHLSLALIKSLCSIDRSTDRKYHFLLGAMNTDKEKIRAIVAECKNIILHENVSDMRTLISSCDIAVSAAGSTLYEICACGVPLIIYSLADNQILGSDAFEKMGLALNIGDLRDSESIDPEQIISGVLDKTAVDRILTAIESLSSDYNRRVQMGTQMQSMIDGHGAERLVKELSLLI